MLYTGKTAGKDITTAGIRQIDHIIIRTRTDDAVAHSAAFAQALRSLCSASLTVEIEDLHGDMFADEVALLGETAGVRKVVGKPVVLREGGGVSRLEVDVGCGRERKVVADAFHARVDEERERKIRIGGRVRRAQFRALEFSLRCGTADQL